MYKRIVHNIIEEHYSVPADTKKMSAGIRVKVASELQMATENLFRDLAFNLRGYIVSVLISGEGSEFLLSKIISNIKEFENFLGGFYGADRVTEIVQHLKEFIDSIKRILILAKAGSDYSMAFDEALMHMDSVAAGISKLNPEHWPESIVKQYLRFYAGLLMDQIVARQAEDWDSEFIAINVARRLMFNGPINIGYNTGMPDFAEYVAAGIFKQFPRKF
jgi:hypothetical protein